MNNLNPRCGCNLTRWYTSKLGWLEDRLLQLLLLLLLRLLHRLLMPLLQCLHLFLFFVAAVNRFSYRSAHGTPDILASVVVR